MSILGYVLSRTKWLPSELAKLDQEELAFAYYWLKKGEDEWWDRLARFLGILWDTSDLPAIRGDGGSDGAKAKSLLIPLLIGLKPEIRKHIENSLDGQAGTGVKADIDLSQLPKEEFLKWANKAVSL